MDVDEILDFVSLLNKFRAVTRIVTVAGENRDENDAEHSFQLAMLAWYILSSGKYDLDKDLVIKYALIHDFVEVHAGDTSFYRSESESNEKKRRENESAKRLQGDFGRFEDLHELIERYEERNDQESRFVYALDKVVPILNIYLDGGSDWRKHQVTLDMLIEAKESKVALSPEVETFYRELLKILKENRHLFHEKQE
ncbi:MAG: HD domain-containing protein [Candidatus Pacebacteria bacterium]|nr:HD domain-containing protein [Candidatus Paceibacterota bacterium]